VAAGEDAPAGSAVIICGVPGMADDSSEMNRLLRQASQGDPGRVGASLEQYRDRLRRLIALRLDPRLAGRINPSDVIQETYLEAAARLVEYLQNPMMQFYLWLRFLAGQKLVTLHQHHLGRQMRDAGREVSLYRGRLPEASSARKFASQQYLAAFERTCGVWVVDVTTGQTVASLKFEDAVQEIFAVQVLSQARFPDLINDDPKILSDPNGINLSRS
jgi:DNA-directed RNA polymerase specialized sigma24 family protein